LQPQLRAIVESAQPAEVRGLLGSILSDLHRLLGYLDSVKRILGLDGKVADALPLLEALRHESLAAASAFDSYTVFSYLHPGLAEELERTSFAVRHELRAVFERMLPGAHAAEARDACARAAEAHDVLRNCFEQSTVALARVFRPDLDAASLFEDLLVKRDNSLRLYEDLSALLRSARHAEWHDGREALSLFSERLDIFCSGTMEYLMEKDREACERFIGEFVWAADRRATRLFLHRFSCYLELLLKHVGMRAVLAGTPLRAVA